MFPIVFSFAIHYNVNIQEVMGVFAMKKMISLLGLGFLLGVMVFGLTAAPRDASAYQLLSSKELGSRDAKNQNIVVKCTTDIGKVSNQTCTLRRYAKCNGEGNNQKCSGWLPWQDLRSPGAQYSNWQAGASACCHAMGLR
jgi:hypothetical protein